jgi:O-antigen/teichoic acid export membrane protein
MTFSNRYLITLSSNIIRAILNFVVSISVARYLMPEAYGDYQYVLTMMTAMMLLVNMGTEKAYFTFISQKLQSAKFHLFYFGWQIVQLIIVFIFIMLLSGDLYHALFKDIEKTLILIAMIAVFFVGNVQNSINHIIESIRKTHYSQSLSIGVAVFHLVVVMSFIYFKNLEIETLFMILFLEYFLYAFVLGIMIKKFTLFSDDEFDLKVVFSKFYRYSKPLFFLSLFGFVYTVTDRWLIQTYVGSQGQAFFAISMQFSALTMLVTSSVLNVFWKEIAESLEKNDIEKSKKYFEVVSKNLFIFTTMVSSILFFFSDEILKYFYTDDYFGASLVFKLIMLYPIFQSMGQLYSSFCLASSQTTLYAKVSYLSTVAGIVLAFWFLADFGLGMGAEGIAIKFLLIGIFISYILEYYIVKYLKSGFDILYKIKYAVILFGISYLLYEFQMWLDYSFIVQVILVGVFYVLPVGIYLFMSLNKKLKY